ncbi:NAD(P)-dependent oxidoreductase [Prescottella equi]|uniref:NAD-dependent epimerase/dehydratase family protein n=1 Tax=Rhodococcus hoagii TaxID=43767 RepID=A0A9Q5F097_RHOHA|nr:NAD(P)-dependent oxidoreductase [Prescottella equi]MBM4479447.1 NAD-dependent epimerase/dehydratase family protein [Prescottella equi]MBM4490245.1 NAD-dependent epimerase/dehydratase family protein [Prescottella equi]MBM4501316.1 NAD-dependent epimerase/dehydratase family protein [Prescottella equi]MBM4507342.1 NAD-dependent epimerase/dehydratase family protein [Prescottella equi]MBM4514141.1 NAD-dependent epimerase/dehydratase family protein [Prescottella equi]
MRILVAGAGGVVGLPLTRELIAQGHAVIGTSRNPDSRPELHDAGATVVRMDAFDLASVEHAIAESRPDAVIHQLTDLSAVDLEANAELRIVGTRNLVDAMRRYGVQRLITQSIAWLYADGDGLADETVPLREATGPSARTIEGVVAMEHTAREIPDHVILRYGKLYGPGTWYSPDGDFGRAARDGVFSGNGIESFLHIADTVAPTVAALGWPAGIVNVVDDEPAGPDQWLPVFCRWVGGQTPTGLSPGAGRGASNVKARNLGWVPKYPSWRMGMSG